MTAIEEHVVELQGTLRKSWQVVFQNTDRDDILIDIYNHFATVHNDLVDAIDDCSDELNWGEVADMVWLRCDCVDLLKTIERLFLRLRYD